MSGRLEVRGLGVTLGRRAVLAGVDLVAEPGSWTAVVGPNGAGKSTLLRAVSGLVRYAGKVLLDGVDVGRLPARRRATLLGYAPQVPVLPDAVTVGEYVMLGRTPYHSLLAAPRSADHEAPRVPTSEVALLPSHEPRRSQIPNDSSYPAPRVRLSPSDPTDRSAKTAHILLPESRPGIS